jgi:hypothetical protein
VKKGEVIPLTQSGRGMLHLFSAYLEEKEDQVLIVGEDAVVQGRLPHTVHLVCE